MYKTGPVASLLLMQKCFPYMKANNYGRIINCSSPSASEGAVVQGPYIMAKCAIEGLTRAAAKEWGQYGITTNVFLPTLWTENFDKSERGKAYAKMMAEQNPVRKFGKPYEDGSPVITFLASEEAGYINGQAICVDGGRCLIY